MAVPVSQADWDLIKEFFAGIKNHSLSRTYQAYRLMEQAGTFNRIPRTNVEQIRFSMDEMRKMYQPRMTTGGRRQKKRPSLF